MPSYTNIEHLQKVMEAKAHEALEQVALEVLEKWKELIRVRVYEQNMLKADPTNDYYARTCQLLESIELKWENPLLVTIYYNTEKILPSMMLDRKSFNRHTSFSGVDWSNAIPYFVEIGNGNSKVYSYEGVHAFDDICDMLRQSFNIMLKRALISRGVM